jgi:heme exporter protein B
VRAALAIAAKDLVLELRGREVVVTLFVFAFLTLTLFSLAAPEGSRAPAELAPGILWVTFLFAGVLGLGRTFERERENECFRGLLLSPVEPMQVYWGKCLSTLAFMLVFQALLWFPFCVLFNFPPLSGFAGLWASFFLGDVGFVALGVLLSATTIHARGREVVLPLLLLPLCLPVLVLGVRAAAAMLGEGGLAQAAGPLGRLAAFDVIFLTLGSLLFSLAVEE